MIRKFVRLFLQLAPGTELRHWLTQRHKDRLAPRLVTPRTDLVVDGFPRSANTWIYYNVQLAFPDLHIAHHVHSWQQFLFAWLFRVPSILVVRAPDASIQSLATKRGGSPTLHYLDYLLTVGAGSVLACDVRFFDDLVAPEGMVSLLNSISVSTDVTPRPVGRDEVADLLALRTNHKNVSTPPFQAEALSPSALALSRLSNRLYKYLRKVNLP
ncbi:hypothetical protein HGG71_08035 [Rhodobacteraceae bacterium R_SAG2]|nr:hypothetical protein [Rhodobacteraceae bacterium R_SAG2]